MLRDIFIFLCIFGIALGASVGTTGGKKSARDLEGEVEGLSEEVAVPEKLTDEETRPPPPLPVLAALSDEDRRPVSPHPVPTALTDEEQRPVPPLPVPADPLKLNPVAIQFPPLDVIRNQTRLPLTGPFPPSSRPAVWALPPQSVYMERYYWPMSAMVRSPAVAPAINGQQKKRSHVPYRHDSAAQPWLPTTPAMVYAQIPYQQSLLNVAPGATAGYPPYYYALPYNNMGEYYYDYFYEENDGPERH